MIQYLITDPKYYTNNPSTFKKVLTKALTKQNVNIACFRDKVSKNTDELAKVFVNVCKEFNIQTILINSNIKLAIKLKATGVHLTSTQFDKIQEVKENNLFTIISCHTEKELINAENLNVDMATYSPIFKTPNKGEPKGSKELSKVVNKSNIPIIALGGILNEKQINEIEKSKAFGFASIRYFYS